MPVGSIGRWYRRYLGMLRARLRHVTSGLMPEALAAGQRQGGRTHAVLVGTKVSAIPGSNGFCGAALV